LTLPPLAEVLPHAPPMILLDELVDFVPGRARCQVRLRPDSPLVEGGRVRALVCVEYMAQAVAAYAGLVSRAAGEAPRIGFLLGTRELQLATGFLLVGDLLAVDVEHVFGDDRIGSFRCRVSRGEEIVAQALLSVYQQAADGALPP
jgi:predicted hotdog family 3-hydroxylacyl-ACP dehydratase